MKNDQGFKNGVPSWETLFYCPVSRECSVDFRYTGELTDKAIDRMIQILLLMRPSFVVPTDEDKNHEAAGYDSNAALPRGVTDSKGGKDADES